MISSAFWLPPTSGLDWEASCHPCCSSSLVPWVCSEINAFR
jgi:hypothetical protein